MEKMSVSKRRVGEAGDDHRSGKYGFFGCTPSFIQWLNNPWSFLVLLLLAMIGNTAAVLGTLLAVLPHIERRFNLSAVDSGLIAAANDVPAVIAGLFVAHYGHYSNKVRWIGVGGVITGIGLFICTLPHYIIGKYEPTSAIYPLCDHGGNLSKIPCDGDEIAPRYHLAIMLIGQLIAGIGTIPMFAFPPAIFRETLKAKYVPLFLALWQTSVFVGPLASLAYSKPLLETWVEPGDKPEGISPQDPRFVSAWWIGFLGPGSVCFLVGMIMLGMPKHIKTMLNDAELEEIKKVDDANCEKTLKEKMVEIPSILKELLTNWTYVFNSMAFNSTLMFAEGLSPFIAKILFLRFGVAFADIGITLNIAVIPPLILGVILSVVLLRFVKIEESGKRAAFICFILQFGAFVPPLGCLLPGCDIVRVAGHIVPYGERTPIPGGGLNLTKTYRTSPEFPYASTCNENCHCSLGFQLPVCGADDVTYLTPCHAGCTDAEFEIPLFTNCSCIPSNDTDGGVAKVGYCDRNCKNWLEFVVTVSVFSLVVFGQLSPSKVVVMRAVKAEHISFAFALHYLSNKVLANIPGPILFGHLVDVSCQIWQKVCGKTGYCIIYDVDDMMLKVAVSIGSLGGIGLVCYFISYLVYTEADPPVVVKKELQVNNPGYLAETKKDGFGGDTKI